MTSTNTLQPNEAISKEMKLMTEYLAIIWDERGEQLRISKSRFRMRLTRIQARKEVFRLDQEIQAKQAYLDEIAESVRMQG